MPSPFPGMDPYLESPSVWHGMHTRLITSTGAILQPRLMARGYWVDVEERVVLTQARRPVYPDVAVFELPLPRQEANESVATLVADEPVRIERATEHTRQRFLNIYQEQGSRLVTSIEFLSPTNKSDADGREQYQQKQVEMAQAGVHLVEIDFIRRGPHVLDIPENYVRSLPRWDYLVNLVRRGGPCHEVYPIRIRDPLPRILVPLQQGDEDEVLDLQAAFDRAYDEGPYPVRLNYTIDPSTPLAEDDAAWAEQLLQQQGLRK